MLCPSSELRRAGCHSVTRKDSRVQRTDIQLLPTQQYGTATYRHTIKNRVRSMVLRIQIEGKFGLRYSILLELLYFNAIHFAAIDPMLLAQPSILD